MNAFDLPTAALARRAHARVRRRRSPPRRDPHRRRRQGVLRGRRPQEDARRLPRGWHRRAVGRGEAGAARAEAAGGQARHRRDQRLLPGGGPRDGPRLRHPHRVDHRPVRLPRGAVVDPPRLRRDAPARAPCGMSVAMEMLLTGERIDAARAREVGPREPRRVARGAAADGDADRGADQPSTVRSRSSSPRSWRGEASTSIRKRRCASTRRSPR